MDAQTEWISLRDAAALVGRKPDTLRAAIKKRGLQARQIENPYGGSEHMYVVRREDALRLFAHQRTGRPPRMAEARESIELAKRVAELERKVDDLNAVVIRLLARSPIDN